MMKEPAEHLYIFFIVTFDILQPHVCRPALALSALDRCVRLEQLFLGLQVQPAPVGSLVAPTCMFLNEPTSALLLSVTRVWGNRMWPDGPAASLPPGSLREVAAIPFLWLQPWAFCSSELCLPPTTPRFPSLPHTVLWGFILWCTGLSVFLSYIGSSKEFHQARCPRESNCLGNTCSLPEMTLLESFPKF